MNKTNKKYLFPIIIWEAVYPVLLYYAIQVVITTLLRYVFNFLDPEGLRGLSGDYPLISLICALITIPFIFSLYCNDRNGNQGMLAYMGVNRPGVKGKQVVNAVFACIITMVIGTGVANLIVMSPIVEISENYQDATAALYSGTLASQLINSVVMVPVLEELLYRGVVLERMKRRLPLAAALLIQAFLFGVTHGNMAQGLFGFVMGIVLGLLAYRTGHIYSAIAGHMAYNCLSLLSTNFGWLKFMKDKSVTAWTMAGVAIAIGTCLLVGYLLVGRKEEKTDY